MKKIDVNFKKPSQQQLNSLLELYQTGRYVDAEKLSVSITEEFPKHPFAWKVLAERDPRDAARKHPQKHNGLQYAAPLKYGGRMVGVRWSGAGSARVSNGAIVV